MITEIFLGEPLSYVEQWIMNHKFLVLVVETTADYKKTGIYSAERDDVNKPITINWGDGAIEEIDGDLSQKVHEYIAVGQYKVAINNIKSYAASIDNSVWYNTTSQNAYTLKEVVTMPDSVTSIGEYAFAKCSSLASVTIPYSATNIGNGTFMQCESLSAVVIPNSVSSIGNTAFAGCISLSNMTIPSNVTNIKSDTFYNCANLSLTFEKRTQSDIDAMENKYWGLNSNQCVPGIV